MKIRNHKGQYRQSHFDRFYGLILLTLTVTLGLVLHRIGEPIQEPFSPKPLPMHITQVFASDIVVEPATIEEQAKAHIRKIFGEDAEKMITIIGTCENGTWEQNRINHNRNGSTDYGIAQVNDLNGARDKQCKGLDYRNSWKDNLDCAYIIYKSQGLSAWACSHKVGVKPFYAN